MADGKDEFTIFLVAGLIILAVLFAVFNLNTAPTGKAVGAQEISVVNLSTAMPVGPESFLQLRTLSFSFDSSNLRQAQEADFGNVTLQSGVLFATNEEKQAITLDNPSKMDIDFTVTKSNGLGPLVTKINGQVVDSRVLEPGDYVFHVDNALLSKDMVITMAAASSGWQIWAPNVYEIQNLRIEAEGYTAKGANYVFNLDQEVPNFATGKVDLSLNQNVGELKAVLNQRTVFDARPPSAVSFEIIRPDLQQGQNALSLQSANDSAFSGTGVISIYYYGQKNDILQTPINLTEADNNTFDEMDIRFDAVRVATPGGLSVKIANSQGTTFTDFAAVSQDTGFEFRVPKDKLNVGYNVLTVSSVDGAVFQVADLDIKLV